jgi:hypothetical protein
MFSLQASRLLLAIQSGHLPLLESGPADDPFQRAPRDFGIFQANLLGNRQALPQETLCFSEIPTIFSNNPQLVQSRGLASAIAHALLYR